MNNKLFQILRSALALVPAGILISCSGLAKPHDGEHEEAVPMAELPHVR